MKFRRKEFRERIVKYEKRKKTLSAYIKEDYLNEDGVAVIDMDLSEVSPLYQPMSVGKQKELNSEILSFLDNKAYPIPAQIPVKVRIFGVPSEEDRRNIESMLREHYDFRAHDKKLDMRLNTVRSIAMYTLGTAMLALYFGLSHLSVNPLFYEIFSIAATFVVWEAVDMSFLERYSLRTDYFDTVQMALAEIEFAD